MAVLREVVFPARLTLVAMALSAALAGALGRLEVELPQELLLEGEAGLLPPQLLPELLREELKDEEEEELKEERPPPPLEPRARLSLMGQTSASERSSARRMGRRVQIIMARRCSG